MDRRDVVALFFEYWKAQDVDMALSLAAEDVVYNLYLSNSAVPHGGETRGRERCREVLYAVLADFDYLHYAPTIVGEDGDVVRAQVEFRYHHRRTGGLLAGTKRMVFAVEDGLITRVDEHHDAGLVEAFMRLTQQREAANEVQAPPELPKGRARTCATPQDKEGQS
ncbi:MAG: nuclear transport factor 2 family protein [Hyphomicrobium sp.]|jgi:ketosteroid isomerase-like protein|nr:nuclear transport factor 2 family protein [Hyphomicrobium sp.]OJU21869.1 MAG: hypothetical protein BGN89_12505 [Alphaproteobacteria bacterium 64-6]